MNNSETLLAGNIGYTRHRLKTKKAMNNPDTVLAGNIGYTVHKTQAEDKKIAQHRKLKR